MRANRNWTFRGVVVFVLVLEGVGCGGGGGGGSNTPAPVAANTTSLSTNLTAAQVVGASTETGTASAALTLNLDDRTLSGTVTLTGLTATGATIRSGFAGEQGPAIVTLQQDNATRWSVPPNTVLAQADRNALDAGGIHVLVTTSAHPAGAVRGQLLRGGVTVQFVNLAGTQEVPLLTSAATGVGAITLNRSSGAIAVHVNTVGLDNAIAAHVHRAIAGVNGPILVGLSQDPADPKHWFSADDAALDAAGLQALDAAQLYLNVHSPANPGGEIRAQIVPSTMAVLFVTLSGAEEVPPVATSARAMGAVTFDPAFPTGNIAVHLNTSGLDDAAMAHVHQGTVGANGPVLIGLNRDPNEVKHWQSDAAVLNSAGIQAFNAGDLYLNVHTPANPNGAVRGQIVPENAPPPNTGSFRVVSTTPSAGANLTSFPSQVVVTFNRAVDAASVTTGSVLFTASGGDGSFGDGNEMGITPTAINASGSTATIDLSSVTVANDTFQVSLKGTGTAVIADLNGNVLDGNGDNAAGGDFVSAFSVTSTSVVTFEFIQTNIFTPSCALSGCHAGPSPQQGMNLSAGQAYAAIVSVPSTEVPSLLRVNPGKPDESYLVHKIAGTAAVGGRMPLGGPPLSDNLIQSMRDWIAAGALNTGDLPAPPPPPGY